MASMYRVAILHRETGEVVSFAPGLDAEAELIDNLCRRVASKGVGIFRTSDHVIADVRTSMDELLRDVKVLAPPPRVG